MSLRDEAVGLLQTLIRLDTVNPPGNETIGGQALRGYLEGQGVECGLYARTPERANLVARIPGGAGPSLASSATPTRWSPIRVSGRAIRGRAILRTSTSGGAERST